MTTAQATPAAKEQPRFWWRIPLYVKVMVSYLFVVSVFFFPTYFLLRDGFVRETRRVLSNAVESDARAIAHALSSTAARRADDIFKVATHMTRHRVTLIAIDGTVRMDSQGVAATMENQREQPEIREALRSGFGTAIRKGSASPRETLYVAVRYPEGEYPQGILRLAAGTQYAQDSAQNLMAVLRRSTAMAISASVLLSLVAAILVSRPLRRMATAARAFSAGDFGHPIGVTSHDELGEAAAALEDLALHLRQRLLHVGNERATLEALLDALPIGVVVYNPGRAATRVNEATRRHLGLSIRDELAQAQRIVDQPDQQIAIAHALNAHTTETSTLVVPWRPSERVTITWIAGVDSNGEAFPIALVSPPTTAIRESETNARMSKWAADLRHALDLLDRHAIWSIAEEIADASPPAPLTPSDVRPVPLGEICARSIALPRALAADAQVQLHSEVDGAETLVVEAHRTVEQALERCLVSAVERAAKGSVVHLRAENHATFARVRIRYEGALPTNHSVLTLLTPLGGDAGSERDNDMSQLWITIPRA